MHASHSRITASEAEIDAKVGELKSPYSPEEFQKKLQEQGLDNDALRKQIRENLILTKLINKDIIAHIDCHRRGNRRLLSRRTRPTSMSPRPLTILPKFR